MYHFGFFNFCNGVSELQMELPNFLGYFNTFVFTVYIATYLTMKNDWIPRLGICNTC